VGTIGIRTLTSVRFRARVEMMEAIVASDVLIAGARVSLPPDRSASHLQTLRPHHHRNAGIRRVPSSCLRQTTEAAMRNRLQD
jgi:hypothetical protein